MKAALGRRCPAVVLGLALLVPTCAQRSAGVIPAYERWAVVIGVGDYASASLQRPRYSVADAEAIYQLLVGPVGFKNANVVLLTDRTERKPTLENLRWALGSFLVQAAKPNDTVLIYFAGRFGFANGTKYLLAQDTEPATLASTALPMDELGSLVDRIASGRVVALFEANYSGSAIGLSAGKMLGSTGSAERLTGSNGRAGIAASQSWGESVELPELGHGVFTYYLLEGVKGAADVNGDGIVTLGELYEYVAQQVRRKSTLAGRPQVPVMAATGTFDFMRGEFLRWR